MAVACFLVRMRKSEEPPIADLLSDACFVSSCSARPCATGERWSKSECYPRGSTANGVRAPMLALTRDLP